MLIIKGQYEEGVKDLCFIIEQIKGEENKVRFKIKRDSSDDKSRR